MYVYAFVNALQLHLQAFTAALIPRQRLVCQA